MWQERDATHASCRSVLVYFLSFFLECQIVRLIIFMIYFPNPRDQCSKVDFSSMCVPLEHWTRGWGFAVFLFYTFRIRKTKKHTHQAEFSLRLFLPHRYLMASPLTGRSLPGLDTLTRSRPDITTHKLETTERTTVATKASVNG